MEFVLAHGGHWVTSVITMAPVAALSVWLLIITVRDRRHRKTEADDAAEEPEPL